MHRRCVINVKLKPTFSVSIAVWTASSNSRSSLYLQQHRIVRSQLPDTNRVIKITINQSTTNEVRVHTHAHTHTLIDKAHTKTNRATW